MRLIDANALSELIWRSSRSAIQEVIQNAPTIEAERIRHGHWEHGKDVFGMYYQCSECGDQYHVGYEFNYCPNCGARMDEEEQA